MFWVEVRGRVDSSLTNLSFGLECRWNPTLAQPANIQAIHKTQTALLLSKKGLPAKRFKVGMKVSFYKPPTAADIARAGRKAKHLTQFHGPAVLTQSLSKSNTMFRLKFNSCTYERRIMNLRHYNSNEAPNIYQLTHVDSS